MVLLQPGDKVPADLRLFQVKSLQIQESLLTGESLAVEKRTVPAGADAELGDRVCRAYSGTLVTYGRGRGVVVATGARTGIPGFLIGNTAESILDSIDCPVLAVKPRSFVTPVALEG